MDRWSDKMLVSLERSKVEVHLFSKYVDDVNLVVDIIPKGWAWVRRDQGEGYQLRWSEERA